MRATMKLPGRLWGSKRLYRWHLSNWFGLLLLAALIIQAVLLGIILGQAVQWP